MAVALSPDLRASYVTSLGVLAASIGFGLAPLFAKALTDAGLASHAIAFYRFLLASVLLCPFLIIERRQWSALLWGGLSGALMGVGWIGYVVALEVAPVPTVGVIYMTYPVFALLLGWALFAERPNAYAVLATWIIITAAVCATTPESVDEEHLIYLALALAAPASFGFSIVVLVHKLPAVSPPARIASASAGAVLGLAPLMLSSTAAEISPDSVDGWTLVLGISLVTALAPQLLYAVCAPKVGSGRTAVLGSVELPTIMIGGWALFGDAVGPMQALACALILSAILLAQRGSPTGAGSKPAPLG